MENSGKRFQCEIVTPEGLMLSGEVSSVVVPGEEGEFGVLPRHAPIVSRTVIGEVRVNTANGGWEHFAVGFGYAKMQFDRLLLLVDTAERATDIDAARAQEALDRADKWLAHSSVDEVDIHRAQMSRRRALNRLKVAGRV